MSTPARGQYAYIRFALRLRIPLAIATMGFAIAGLMAIYFRVDLLLRPLGGRSATHPFTALCMFGLGLCIYKMQRFKTSLPWRKAIAATIIAVCAIRVISVLSTGWTQVSSLAVFGPVGPFVGHFSIESAFVMGTIALAGLFRQWQSRLGLLCLVLAWLEVYNVALEISYGMVFFNGDVGAFTILGLVCATLAMLTVYLHRPLLRVSFLRGEIGSQTRVMAFAAVAVPWLCGYFLFEHSTIAGVSGPIEAVTISFITWSMVMILLTTSARHEGSDAARRRAEREIAMISRTDPLTKALNRFGMNEVLDTAWKDYRSAGALYGTILLDLDHFKRINDTFGHDAGDDVLARVSATLRPHLRHTDALGRWGGEEFLILLKIRDVSDLETVAERMRRALGDINSPFCAGLSGEPLNISASLEISYMRSVDQGPGDTIKRADAGLYQAKEDGRNRVVPNYTLIAA